MTILRRPTVFITLISVAVTLTVAASATPPSNQHPHSSSNSSAPRRSGPVVIRDSFHGTSPTLRSLRGKQAAAPPRDMPDQDTVLPASHPVGAPHKDAVRQLTPASALPAAVLQSVPGIYANEPVAGTATTISELDLPPDPNMAVGTTQIVDIVNHYIAVYDKTGALLPNGGPFSEQLLWPASTSCGTDHGGDGVARYDTLANVWVISQLASGNNVCVAVSKTADVTGAYNTYEFPFANFPDYQKLGIWPDAYYLTHKGGPQVCALDRTSMIAGAAATAQCFTPSSGPNPLLPADLDGTTAPPAGEPETLIGLGSDLASLDYYKFHVDWTTPADSTLTGPTAVAVTPYTLPCASSQNGDCVPQKNTTQQINPQAPPQFRLAYRDFGDHESLVLNHTVDDGGPTAIRWYELRIGSGGALSVLQQATYDNAGDGVSRYMGSIAMDKAGDIALGYNSSSPNIYPSIAFTGRLAGDPVNQMTFGEGTIWTGTGFFPWDRVGDYSAMNIDPVDGCTFWYTNEYDLTSDNHQYTRLGAFQLPGCSIANPSFETGDLRGWTPSGSATAVGPGLGDNYAAQLGASTATDGDSSISTTFTATTAKNSTLTFWYDVTCPDTVTYDWATATLTDNTTNTTTTPLPHTCTSGAGWNSASAQLTAGHTYTLTLTSHDDNYPADPTYTLFDDITLS